MPNDCCSTATLCLRKPEVFNLSIKLRQPPYNILDKCSPDRTGQAMPLSKAWALFGQIDKSDECKAGYKALGLEGERTLKICGGESGCLNAGTKIMVGGDSYTILSSAIAPSSSSLSNVLGSASSGGSGLAGIPGYSSCGCDDAATIVTASGDCQYLVVDRPLAKDYENTAAVAESVAINEVFKGDRLSDGSFRVRINSDRLPRGDIGVMSFFLAQKVGARMVERIYTGISLPVSVI